jgi:outer membrane lipoprotein-sorting protein
MKIIRFSLLIGLISIFAGAEMYAQDALTVVKKLDATLAKVSDKTVDVEMTLEDLKTKKTETKKAILMQKGMNMKLFRYTAPKSDSGIATLSLPTGEIYVYLPMFKKPKKMTNLAESKAFNKSDFSIADMSNSGFAENYTLNLLATEAAFYTVEFIPKNKTGEYGKLVMNINKTNFYPDRIEYYDTKMVLEKFAVYHHINVKGIWVADKVTMENVKTKHKTTLKISNFKLNQGLSDSVFTVEKLAPGKG